MGRRHLWCHMKLCPLCHILPQLICTMAPRVQCLHSESIALLNIYCFNAVRYLGHLNRGWWCMSHFLKCSKIKILWICYNNFKQGNIKSGAILQVNFMEISLIPIFLCIDWLHPLNFSKLVIYTTQRIQ